MSELTAEGRERFDRMVIDALDQTRDVAMSDGQRHEFMDHLLERMGGFMHLGPYQGLIHGLQDSLPETRWRQGAFSYVVDLLASRWTFTAQEPSSTKSRRIVDIRRYSINHAEITDDPDFILSEFTVTRGPAFDSPWGMAALLEQRYRAMTQRDDL